MRMKSDLIGRVVITDWGIAEVVAEHEYDGYVVRGCDEGIVSEITLFEG
jgi:hypothetical protein